MSQLIAKLDPVFAFNASSASQTRDTGLVNALVGTSQSIFIGTFCYEILIDK